MFYLGVLCWVGNPKLIAACWRLVGVDVIPNSIISLARASGPVREQCLCSLTLSGLSRFLIAFLFLDDFFFFP